MQRLGEQDESGIGKWLERVLVHQNRILVISIYYLLTIVNLYIQIDEHPLKRDLKTFR